MIVVSDTSPLIALSAIGQLHLLPTLFVEILIPPEVREEMDAPAMSADRFFSDTPWLVVQAPKSVRNFPGLHAGESAAIALAREIKADYLVIDDKVGRRIAESLGLPIVGTVGILEIAAVRGLIDLATAFDALKLTTFRIDHRLLSTRLNAYRRRIGLPHPPATA